LENRPDDLFGPQNAEMDYNVIEHNAVSL